MTRDELIGVIYADAKFMDQREDIAAYIDTLKIGEGLSDQEIKQGYETSRTKNLPADWQR